MTTLEIQWLLFQRSAFMCGQCPAYHLDKTLMDALRPMLRDHPAPLGPLFHTYDQLSWAHHFKQCRSTYLYMQKLAKASSVGVFPLPASGALSQEDLLTFVPQPRKLIQARKALWGTADQAQRPILEFYDLLSTDMMDLEQMFCSFFGCQAGEPDPKYEFWVRKTILPNRYEELSWWASPKDGNV